MNTPTIYTTREEALNAFVDASRAKFESVGASIPFNTRVSIGYPTTGAKGQTIAQIVHHMASRDGHFEIFVSPVNTDAVAVFAALTHELIHAAMGLEAGHDKKKFGDPARALGLEGPLTATVPGPDWFAWAAPIMEGIDMPYAAIDLSQGKVMRRKKKTYLLKVECPDCGWLARVSATHCHEGMTCPVPLCDGELTVERNDDSE